MKKIISTVILSSTIFSTVLAVNSVMRSHKHHSVDNMRCTFCKGTGFSGMFNCQFCKGTGRNSSYWCFTSWFCYFIFWYWQLFAVASIIIHHSLMTFIPIRQPEIYYAHLLHHRLPNHQTSTLKLCRMAHSNWLPEIFNTADNRASIFFRYWPTGKKSGF